MTHPSFSQITTRTRLREPLLAQPSTELPDLSDALEKCGNWSTWKVNETRKPLQQILTKGKQQLGENFARMALRRCHPGHVDVLAGALAPEAKKGAFARQALDRCDPSYIRDLMKTLPDTVKDKRLAFDAVSKCTSNTVGALVGELPDEVKDKKLAVKALERCESLEMPTLMTGLPYRVKDKDFALKAIKLLSSEQLEELRYQFPVAETNQLIEATRQLSRAKVTMLKSLPANQVGEAFDKVVAEDSARRTAVWRGFGGITILVTGCIIALLSMEYIHLEHFCEVFIAEIILLLHAYVLYPPSVWTPDDQRDDGLSSQGPRQLSLKPQDVEEHNYEHDCWVIINGKVYEVTAYLASQKHPGGNAGILEWAGKDASEEFNMCHPPSVLEQQLSEDDCLGDIVGTDTA